MASYQQGGVLLSGESFALTVLLVTLSESKGRPSRRRRREKPRPRAKVESKISEDLKLHGLRRGRYFGEEKTDLQAVMTASMVNTKRLLTLSEDDAKLAKSVASKKERAA